MPKLQVLDVVVVTMVFEGLLFKSETGPLRAVFMPGFEILLLNSCKSLIKLLLEG